MNSGGQGKEEVDVTLAVFIRIPGKVMMLRRKNRIGGGNSGSGNACTEEAGHGEAGDIQERMGNMRVKVGRSIGRTSRELGIACVGLLFAASPEERVQRGKKEGQSQRFILGNSHIKGVQRVCMN